MHIARAVYEHRWTGLIGLVVGLVALTAGMTIHGKGGADLLTIGGVLSIAALLQFGHVAALSRMRAAHRYARLEQSRRTGRVLVRFPRGEDTHR